MHGGDIYGNKADIDFSVSLNPLKISGEDRALLERAMEEGLKDAVRYPDPFQRAVREALSKVRGVPFDCVYAANGASELIMGITAMRAPCRALLIEPGYTGYAHALDAQTGCRVSRHFLKEEDGFMLTSAVLDEMTEDTDLMILQDPQNPTGRNIDPKLEREILDKAADNNITILYDKSFSSLSEKGDMTEAVADNVYIVSSYTKSFGLPGIRMGYVMSTKENIKRLTAFLPEWNLSSLAQSVMKVLPEIEAKKEYLKSSVSCIRKEREFLSDGLSGLGFRVYESDTVFILVRCPEGCGKLYDRLLEKGILIRKCDDFKGLGTGFCRIGIRSHEENIILVDKIKEVIHGA